MIRSHVGWALAAFAAHLLSAGMAMAAAASQPATSQSGGADSPKALLEQAHAAVTAMDVEAITACVAPDYRPAIRSMMTAANEFSAKVAACKKAVEAKLGQEAAETAFKDALDRKDNSPLKDAVEDGAVNWDKVQIKVEGDEATVEINGKRKKDVAVQKVAGRWFIVPGNSLPTTMTRQAERVVARLRMLGQGLDDFTKRLADGQVAKDRVQEEMGLSMMKALGAGPTSAPSELEEE